MLARPRDLDLWECSLPRYCRGRTRQIPRTRTISAAGHACPSHAHQAADQSSPRRPPRARAPCRPFGWCKNTLPAHLTHVQLECVHRVDDVAIGADADGDGAKQDCVQMTVGVCPFNKSFSSLAFTSSSAAASLRALSATRAHVHKRPPLEL
jgi:hypothetical protein